MPETAPFVFGTPELFFTLLSSGIILGIIGPKFIKQWKGAEASLKREDTTQKQN